VEDNFATAVEEASASLLLASFPTARVTPTRVAPASPAWEMNDDASDSTRSSALPVAFALASEALVADINPTWRAAAGGALASISAAMPVSVATVVSRSTEAMTVVEPVAVPLARFVEAWGLVSVVLLLGWLIDEGAEVLVSVSSEALRSFPAVATAPLLALAVGVATDVAGLTVRVSTASTGALGSPGGSVSMVALLALARGDCNNSLARDDCVAALRELALARRVTGMETVGD